MSHEATSEAVYFLESPDSAPLRPIDRLVLLLLANRHNRDTGMAWPSVALLAQEAGVTVRHVQASLRRLERTGFIRRQARVGQGGAQSSNGYSFPAVRGSGGEAEFTGGVKRSSPGGEAGFRGRVNYSSPGGEAEFTGGVKRSSPKPLVEPLIEPSDETLRNNAPTALDAATVAAWRSAFRKDPNAHQRAMLIRHLESADLQGMPGLVSRALQYTGERDGRVSYYQAVFEGSLRDRTMPGDSKAARRADIKKRPGETTDEEWDELARELEAERESWRQRNAAAV